VIDDQSTSSVTKVANPDGSVTAFAYEQPLFVRQPGRRARLDATLAAAAVTNRDEVASGRALKDGLSVKRTAARGATWTIGGAAVTLEVVDAAPEARGELEADGAVRFRDAQPNADVVVRSSGSGPSMDLLLKDAAAPPTMRLRVTDPDGALGGLGGATPYGGWRFGGSTDTRYLGLAPPFAYEQAKGQSLPPTPGSAHLQVQQERPGVYLVTETVDRDWLKGKSYPIVLDPAFTDRDEGQLNDCQIYSGAYQYANWCPGGMDYVRAWSGYYGSDNQKYVGRALLHPNVDQLTSDGGGTYLQDAYFGFYMADSTGNNLHDVCAGGTFWGTGANTTWANTAGGAPLDGNGTPRYCSSFWASTGQWGYPNVTDILRNSKNGAFPYYGFVLRDNDEVNYQQQSNFDGGASPNPAAHPFFAVTYAVTTQPPTNVTTQATNNGSTGTSSVTAAWSYPADNGGADLSYQTAYYAYLYTCDADYVGESGWLNRDTGTWQWNGLDPQQCYKAYVRAGNPAGVSGYGTGTSAFGYAQRPGLTTTSTGNAINVMIDYPAPAGPCRVCSGDGGAPLDQYVIRVYLVGQRWPGGTVLGEKAISNPGFGQRQQVAFSPASPASNGWVPGNGTAYSVDVFPHTPTGVSYRDPATGAVGAPGYGLIAGGSAGTPGPPTALSPPGSSTSPATVTTGQPVLTATVGSGQGDQLATTFTLHDGTGATVAAGSGGSANGASAASSWTVPAATLSNNQTYSWTAHTCNSGGYCTPESNAAYFNVNGTNPVPVLPQPDPYGAGCIPAVGADVMDRSDPGNDPSMTTDCGATIDPLAAIDFNPDTRAGFPDYPATDAFTGQLYSPIATNTVRVLQETVSTPPGPTWTALGLLRNERFQQDVASPTVTAILYSAANNQLATLTATSPMTRLRPGEPAPFSITSNVPTASVDHVVWAASAGSGLAAVARSAGWMENWVAGSGSRPALAFPDYSEDPAAPSQPFVLAGQLTNTGSATIANPLVLVAIYDNSGKVVSVMQKAAVNPTTGAVLTSLAPGGTADAYVTAGAVLSSLAPGGTADAYVPAVDSSAQLDHLNHLAWITGTGPAPVTR